MLIEQRGGGRPGAPAPDLALGEFGPSVKSEGVESDAEVSHMGGADFNYDGNVFSIVGEVDIANTADLAAALEQVPGNCVVVDCAGLVFIDSSGIGALLSARPRRRAVRLVNVPKSMESVVRLLGLQEAFGFPATGGDGA